MENLRTRNLRKLITEEFNGSQTELAARTGLSLSQLGQYLSGYRNMGEKTARKIEAGCKKRPGWLDEDPNNSGLALGEERAHYDVQRPEPELPPAVKAVVAMMMNTDEEGQQRIKLSVSDTLFQYNKLKQERIQALGLLPADLVEELRQATDPKIVELIRGTLLMLDVPQARRMAK